VKGRWRKRGEGKNIHPGNHRDTTPPISDLLFRQKSLKKGKKSDEAMIGDDLDGKKNRK